MALVWRAPVPEIHLVPCLKDNYAYVIECTDHQAIVIDPSEGQPVLDFVNKRGLTIAGILNTHHHQDHIGGNSELKRHFSCPVYGFAGDRHRIAIDIEVQDEQVFFILNCRFRVMHIPGHTLGHIAYVLNDEFAVFSGDTLFSLGCGRLFEGSPEQMVESLSKLGGLNSTCLVYCGHEYTLNNVQFLKSLSPHSNLTQLELELTKRLSTTRTTLPSTIEFENLHNPFLSACRRGVTAFRTLREQKDHFHV